MAARRLSCLPLRAPCVAECAQFLTSFEYDVCQDYALAADHELSSVSDILSSNHAFSHISSIDAASCSGDRCVCGVIIDAAPCSGDHCVCGVIMCNKVGSCHSDAARCSADYRVEGCYV